MAKYDATGALVWARAIGGAGSDIGFGIALDGTGNVCITGQFQGSNVDFDPGPGIFLLNSTGASDVFVLTLDGSGSFVWAVAMGGAGNDVGLDIAVDGTGNVVTTGQFGLAADFDPGAGTFNCVSNGGNDVFVSKLSTTGTFLWAASLGGPSNDDNIGGDIAVDGIGNVYFNGDFRGTVDFDPGPGTFNLTSFAGSEDIFVAKLNSAGNFVWAGQMGGGQNDSSLGIAVDGNGNVLTTGAFISAAADFDPGPGTFNFSNTGFSDIYVSKLDTNGNFVWAQQMPTTGGGSDQGNGIAVDTAGSVFVVGHFTAQVDFDPGAGVFFLSPAGSRDIFVAQLDSAGNFVWAGNMGGAGATNQGRSIAVNGNDAIYVTGVFANTTDFDPGAATSTLTSAGADDAFILKLISPQVNLVPTGGSTNIVEGGTTDSYTIVLATLPAANVVVTLIPDSQETLSATSLTFTPVNWNLPQTITVFAVDDVLVEGPHTGIITHTAASTDLSYNSIPVSSITANITDNDFATPGITITQSAGSTDVTEGGATETVTIVLNAMPTANVVVTLAPDSQVSVAPTLLTFTPLTWNIVQTVTVTAVNDLVAEGAHSGVLTPTATSADPNYNGLPLSALTAAITDNDSTGILDTQSGGTTTLAEAGGSDTLSVVLNSQPTANVAVTLSPDAQITALPAALTFTPANWNVPQTVTVAAVNDLVAEGPHNGVLSFLPATSSDPFYNLLNTSPLTAAITDNDTPGVTLAESFGSTNVAESGTTDTYTLVLISPPTANVVITPNPGIYLTASPTTITFTAANWNVPQTLTVAALDDLVYQGPHTGTITHTAASADPMYNGIAIAAVTANIADNDPPPGVSIQGNVSMIEGGSSSYTIVLQTQPAASVTINLAPDPQLLLTQTSLTFTPANWNVVQTVAVSTLDDFLPEPNQTGVITQTVTSADPLYNGMPLSAITAHVVDNDGTLVLGTDGDDNILVNCTGTRVQAIVNGKSTYLTGPIQQIVVFAQAGNDFVQITTPTVPVVVLGGTGVDAVWTLGKTGLNNFTLNDTAVTVNNQTVSIGEAESLVLGGRTSNDTFTIQNLPTIPTEFKGDRGNDSIIAPNTANTWNLTTPNGGTLNGTLTINGIENWLGGTGDDTYLFSDRMSLTGKLDGRAGSNTVDWSAYTVPLTVNLQTGAATGAKTLANVQMLKGGQSSDKLTGRNQTSAWSLTGSNAGSVNGVSFQNFENLTGGTLADTFTLADGAGVSGKIDGAAGSDVLDYSAYLAAVAIDLQMKAATNTGGILNLENLLAGSGAGDTLTGLNASNKWILTGSGSGTLNKTTFAAFENFQGGTGSDTFTLGPLGTWSGLLSGSKGPDSLLAFAGVLNVWTNTTPNAGKLNGVPFTDIEFRR